VGGSAGLFELETEVVVINFGPNVAIFLLFFGVALLDALRSRDLVGAFLWLALGLVFLRADALKRTR
jgi:hypothetical protein